MDLYRASQLLWHKTSVFAVSSKRPNQLVALYDKERILRTQSNPDTHGTVANWRNVFICICVQKQFSSLADYMISNSLDLLVKRQYPQQWSRNRLRFVWHRAYLWTCIISTCSLLNIFRITSDNSWKISLYVNFTLQIWYESILNLLQLQIQNWVLITCRSKGNIRENILTSHWEPYLEE